MAWEAPISDGGARLLQYIIEIRSLGEEDFKEVGKVKAGNLNYEVIGLEMGQQYEFRVKAVSPAGASQDAARLDTPVTPHGK